MSRVLLKQFLQLLLFYIESAAVIDRKFVTDCIDNLIDRL